MRRMEHLAFAVALMTVMALVVTFAAVADADVQPEISSVELDNDQERLTYTVLTDASSIYVQIRDADTGEIVVYGQNPDVSGSYTGHLDVSGLPNGTYVLWVQAYEGTGYVATERFVIDARDVSVTGVSIADDTTEMKLGSSVTLVATIEPEDAADQRVTWESSDPGTVSVDGDGVATANAIGTATVTVRTVDGGFTDSIEITVVEEDVEVTGVSLNRTSLTLVVGGSSTLVATISPAGATNQDVTWESSDPSVASVVDGVVQAVSAGTTTVTVTTADGGYTAECRVTVNAPVSSGIYLSPSSLSLEVGDTGTISVTATGYSYSDLRATSSNEGIVAVWFSGSTLTVTAVSAGTATVTVYYAYDSDVTATAFITVTEPEEELVENDYTFFIKMNKDAELVDPEDAGGRTIADLEAGFEITGRGYNAAEALVNACADNRIECDLWWGESGGQDLRGWINTLMGMRQYQSENGDWTYWIQYHNGIYNEFTLGYYTDGGYFSLIWDTTSAEVQGSVSLSQTTLSLNVGETATLIATVTPEGASLTWESSNQSVATVDGNGVVTALSAGTTTITVTASNGLSATCRVTVTESSGIVPTGVSLNRENAVMAVGSTLRLTATVTPSNASTTLSWTSSDESVATVDEEGVITALSAGTTTITVTTSNNLSASCEITVREGVTTETIETIENEDGTVTTIETVRTEFTDGFVQEIRVETVTSPEGDVISVTTTETTIEADGSSEQRVEVEAITDAGTVSATTVITRTSDGGSTTIAAVTVVDGDVETSASMTASSDGTVESSMDVTVRADTGSGSGVASAVVDGDVMSKVIAQIAEAGRYVTDAEATITVVAASGDAGITAAQVDLTDEAVEALASAGAPVTVVTDLGILDIAAETVSNIGTGMHLSITDVGTDDLDDRQAEAVGSGTVYDVSIVTSDGSVHELGADMTIRLRYVLGEGESPDDVRVYYFDDAGNIEEIDSEYDEEGQFAVFATDHLSVYAVTASSSPAPSEEPSSFPWAMVAAIVVVILVVAVAALYLRGRT